jgi:hypothetical protein
MLRQKFIPLFLSSYLITAVLAAILSILPYCHWLALVLMALITLHVGYRQGAILFTGGYHSSLHQNIFNYALNGMGIFNKPYIYLACSSGFMALSFLVGRA